MDYLTTHTSLSPIWHGFAPGFVNYKKRCTRLAAASDKIYQWLAHGGWSSPRTPASSTTKTGRHDIAEILLKVALTTNTKNQSNQNRVIEDRSCFYILYTMFHGDVAYSTLYGILKLVSMKATLQQVTSIWMLSLVSISLSKTLDYVCFVCFWFETVYINCLSDSEPIGRGARPTNSLLLLTHSWGLASTFCMCYMHIIISNILLHPRPLI